MAEPLWGESIQGVRFGLRAPPSEVQAGASVVLELICENRSASPISVYGFVAKYPRALRVSPPKPNRPWVRVSFGDVNVLHPPEAFTTIPARTLGVTTLDVSFAMERLGPGVWGIAFAYDAVRAVAGMRTWHPPPDVEARTAVADMSVVAARTLREAGIDEATERTLDGLLLAGDATTADALRKQGPGGAAFAARRVARILAPGEALLGWRALDALALLGAEGVAAVRAAREELPHAAPALELAADVLAHRAGEAPPIQHLPFVTALEQMATQPDSRGNFLLTWTAVDSPVHGLRRLEILGDGEKVVTVRAPDANVGTTRRTRMSPMQMQLLFESLRYSAVWLLRPLRDRGLPDEPRPALEIQLALGDAFQRHVAMWNGEWQQGPATHLADLLDRVSRE